MKVKLKTPIMVSNEQVSELELRMPTVKDIKDLDLNNGIELTSVLLTRIASPAMSSIEVEHIELPDFMHLTEVIGGFFETSKE